MNDTPLTSLRISTTEGDAGYRLCSDMQKIGIYAHGYLDDVYQAECVTIDPQIGLIVRAKLDADGEIIIEGDEIAYETVHGCVRWELILRMDDPS